MDGFEVKKMENAVKEADIVVTTTGCRDLSFVANILKL
jgi:adenosylhomocysteinase